MIFAKKCCLTPMFYFSNGGHVVRPGENYTNFELDTLVILQTKYGAISSSGFREEDF